MRNAEMELERLSRENNLLFFMGLEREREDTISGLTL